MSTQHNNGWVAALTRDNGLLIEAADRTKAGAKCINLAGRLEKTESDLTTARAELAKWRTLAEEGALLAVRYGVSIEQEPIAEEFAKRVSALAAGQGEGAGK